LERECAVCTPQWALSFSTMGGLGIWDPKDHKWGTVRSEVQEELVRDETFISTT